MRANTRYAELLAEAEHRFHTDQVFAAQCLEASRWVLDKRLPRGTGPTQEQLRSAVWYFLAGLPLFIDTAGIVGAPRSIFGYHQSSQFLRRLYRRELSWHPVPNQGFAVITLDGPLEDRCDGPDIPGRQDAAALTARRCVGPPGRGVEVVTMTITSL